jgi:RND family efflux transporter MFP subunit
MPAHDLSALRIRRDDDAPRPRPFRRLVIWGIVLAAVATGAWLAIGRADWIPRGTEVVRVARPRLIQAGGASEVLTATGYIVPQRRAAVSARVFGRLEWLGVREGDRVTTGQVIGRLASDDLAAQVAEARATLAQARAQREQARAAEWEARREEQRQAKLLADGITTQTDHDAARRALDVAVAGVAAAEESVNAAQARLDLASVNLEKTNILAPFDGIVTARNAEVGEMVAATTASGGVTGGTIATVADFSTLEMEADINESNIARVKPGQPALISVDGVPGHRYRGTLRLIVPAADRQKAVVMAKVTILDLDERLVPDMSARIAFLDRVVEGEEAARPPRMFVPAAAVRGESDALFVLVVSDERIVRLPVQLGEAQGDLREVLSGLKGDEAVVISGPQTLHEADRVRVAP